MSDTVSLKVIDLATKRLDEEYERAGETLTSGTLRNYEEVSFAYGYRKALRDAKTLLTESLEDVMKE